MREEKINKLLHYKVICIRHEKYVISGWFPHYWDMYPFKEEILMYPGETIKEQIYRYLNNDTKEYKCLWCGNSTKYKTLNKGFDEYCSRRCVNNMVKAQGNFTTKGYKHSEETKKKMSENHADVTGENNPFRNACKENPKLREKISKRKKQWWDNLSKKEREKISQIFSKGQANSKNKHSSYKRHKSGFFWSNKMFQEFYYRSSWEEQTCEILEKIDEVEQYYMEDFYIKYVTKQNRTRYTRIDFYIKTKDKNIIFEVKPLSLINFNNNLEKIAGIQEYCINYDYEFYLIHKDIINIDHIRNIFRGNIENDNYRKFE